MAFRSTRATNEQRACLLAAIDRETLPVLAKRVGVHPHTVAIAAVGANVSPLALRVMLEMASEHDEPRADG